MTLAIASKKETSRLLGFLDELGCSDFVGKRPQFARTRTGSTNEVYMVQGSEGRAVLKIFSDCASVKKAVAVQCVLKDVPTAAVIARSSSSLLFEYVSGTSLPDGRISGGLAESIGRVLRSVHSVRFPSMGLLGSGVDVVEVWSSFSTSFLSWLREMLRDRAGELLPAATCHSVIELAESRIPECNTLPPVLCHGDIGRTNMLVRGERIVALIDWDFCFSGPFVADIGQVLRLPIDTGALSRGYCRDDDLDEGWLELARVHDLLNMVYFLNEEPGDPKLQQPALTGITDTLQMLGCGD